MMKWLKHLCDGESAKVNVAPARDRIEDIHCFLDNEELTGENSRKLRSKRFAKKQQMQWCDLSGDKRGGRDGLFLFHQIAQRRDDPAGYRLRRLLVKALPG